MLQLGYLRFSKFKVLFFMTSSIFSFHCVGMPLVHRNCHFYDAKTKFDDSSGDLQKIEDGIFLAIFYF